MSLISRLPRVAWCRCRVEMSRCRGTRCNMPP
jgi:hypothetical protein